MVILNCSILNNKFGRRKMPQNEYREAMAKYLLRDGQICILGKKYKRSLPIPAAQEGHWPVKLGLDAKGHVRRRECQFCKVTRGEARKRGIDAIRKTSTIQCELCHVTLCIVPCFADYHRAMYPPVPPHLD
jgi:hypothetical protein